MHNKTACIAVVASLLGRHSDIKVNSKRIPAVIARVSSVQVACEQGSDGEERRVVGPRWLVLYPHGGSREKSREG